MAVLLKEAIQRLTDAQHRQAIWRKLSDSLQSYLDSDVGTTEQFIEAPNSIIKTVSQSVIESVLEEIEQGPLHAVHDEIEMLSNMQMKEPEDAGVEEQEKS